MITLASMVKAEFDANIDAQIKDYADEKVKAGTWTEEEAFEKSNESFNNLLPEGLKTSDHYFLSIRNDERNVGYFWYYFAKEANNQKEAFIYNFLIFDEHRGKGYGKKALEELEKHVKKEGIKKLTLHVFGHNKRAIHLYNKMKFDTTDLVMSKHL
ncbi:GNAT family N-acetyltransferase [Halobacillus mangrovi]|uniref:GNAT family N-acetyltransferase n=1 Tax=Halobacillus mangrovi TaxID=402384 RepID=A0A1W5ZVQ7_9BACI|nr:GNAT family N-acetyltransferase [Halobacillus mangrovi]ARI77349.1 GNAT family N-acetyltransferase [Halobacillus mangrovi]